MLEGNFLGLPRILWVVILGSALLVDIPLVLLQSVVMGELRSLHQDHLAVQSAQVHPMPTPTVTLVPSPTVSVVPTVSRLRTATPSAQVKQVK